MLTFKRHILALALLAMSFTGIAAQDSLYVSLLTCTPGKELYTKFGHTAIRLHDRTTYDWVFNYGCFNYNSDNFVWKFVLGQTDYMLEAEPMVYFMERYRKMGVGVIEQRLNFSQKEIAKLKTLLEVNMQPENQQYRYNWLHDNCTERARDMLIKANEGMVDYERRDDGNITVRDILHHCLRNDPWTDWGISMILGSEIDLPADKMLQMFIPNIFRMELNEANLVSMRMGVRPVVKDEVELLKPTLHEDSPSVLSPVLVLCLLLAAVVAVTVRDFRRKRQSVWLDIALCLVQGIAGCVITFLFFVSQHPCVDSNWLIMIFNPIALFYAGWIFYCHKRKKRNLISMANVTVLTAFLPTMWLCMQSFYIETYLAVMILLVRAVAQMALFRRKFEQHK